MLSQSLLTLVDTAMVAALDDPSALAGVGLGGYASFLAVALVLGLSVGVQTVVARNIGAGDTHTAFRALNSGLAMAAFGGLILSVICFIGAPLLHNFSDDPAVGVVAVEYFEYRSLSVAVIAINFTYRGYWTGVRKVSVFIRMALLSQFCNLLFSYGLIFGELGMPELGAAGSGLGTTIAVFVGMFGYTILTRLSNHGELLLRSMPSAEISREIFRLSLPNGIQQLLMATGMLLYFALLARISVETAAVGHAIINISLFIILPGNGLGMAATTLVSQALGREQPEDAYRWGWDTVKLTAILMAGLGMPLWLAPEFILHWFLPDELVATGTLPLRMTGLIAVFQSVGIVLSQSLLGAGKARQVMLISFGLQWCWGLPLAAFVGLYLGYGFIGVWCVSMVDRIISATLYSMIWRRRHWMPKPDKHQDGHND